MSAIQPNDDKGRQPTGSAEDDLPGALPAFIVIGAQKCGTGFFYRRLKKHPSIKPSKAREVHYFDDNFHEGLAWYKSQFPGIKNTRAKITGEKSPYYLFHPHAPRRVSEVLPDVRLISLLRDPVDRAYSSYQHQVRAGRETLSFEAAIEAEEGRLLDERERMLADETYVSPNHRHFSYLSRSVYVDQLKSWHQYFGRDQLLVLKSEDMFERPQQVLNRAVGFCGLPEWDFGPLKRADKPGYAPMDPRTRSRLESFFEPHNQRLYEYLGRDFGW